MPSPSLRSAVAAASAGEKTTMEARDRSLHLVTAVLRPSAFVCQLVLQFMPVSLRRRRSVVDDQHIGFRFASTASVLVYASSHVVALPP